MIWRVSISIGVFAIAFMGGRELTAPPEGETMPAIQDVAMKQPAPIRPPPREDEFRSMLDKHGADEELPLKLTLLRWIERDPEAAFAYALEQYDGDKHWQQNAESLPMFVIRRWALKDVRAAMRKYPRAYHYLLAHAPRQFLFIAEEQGETNLSLWHSAGRHLARKDVASAIQIARSKDPTLQANLLTGIARTLADSDPVRALNLIVESEEIEEKHSADADTLTAILRNLAKHDPDLAAEQAGRNERWRDVYAAVLAESDPAEAINWFRKQGGNRMPAQLTTNLSLHLDNAAVSTWLDLEANTELQFDEFGNLHVWYPPDTREAVDTLVALPPSKARDALLTRALEIWTRENPREAIHYAVEHLPSDADYTERPSLGGREFVSLSGLDAHLGAIAAENAHEAVKLLTELPDRFHTSELATWIGRQWSLQDLTEASQWAGAQPEGPLRDGAIRGMLVPLAYEAPAEALEWVSALQDSAERQHALEQVMGVWKTEAEISAIHAEIGRHTALPEDTKIEALRILEEE